MNIGTQETLDFFKCLAEDVKTYPEFDGKGILWVHLMPYYQQWGNRKGDLPIVEEYYEHCLSLPMYPTLTDEEQEYVIKKVIEFVAK